mmetsp:Transcript_15286/g.43080  ORF Transcript_15286/g.43080 Transcript_15286/m.43080 type:complete len:220 (+) Transcript_15286:1734-2393(+)
MAPNCSKCSCSSSSVVPNGRFRTNRRFLGRSSFVAFDNDSSFLTSLAFWVLLSSDDVPWFSPRSTFLLLACTAPLSSTWRASALLRISSSSSSSLMSFTCTCALPLLSRLSASPVSSSSCLSMASLAASRVLGSTRSCCSSINSAVPVCFDRRKSRSLIIGAVAVEVTTLFGDMFISLPSSSTSLSSSSSLLLLPLLSVLLLSSLPQSLPLPLPPCRSF